MCCDNPTKPRAVDLTAPLALKPKLAPLKFLKIETNLAETSFVL